MQTKAKLKYLKISPRKVRLVLDVIRGMDAKMAKEQLKFLNKKSNIPILKLLNSAIANAKENQELEESNLYIKEVRADEGPTYKRWRARARGRADTIRKRTSHVTIILDERKPSKGRREPKKIEMLEPIKFEEMRGKEKAEEKVETPPLDLASMSKKEKAKEKTGFFQKEKQEKKREPGRIRRLFRRKSI